MGVPRPARYRSAGFSPPARHCSAGFSVIEVLIAAGIFLIIAVGLLPLFVQSIRNNLSGRDATDVSNMAKSRVEELFQLPFDSPRLDLPAGATELWVSDFYVKTTAGYGGEGFWTTAAPASGQVAPWARATRVRQFSIDRESGQLSDPLDGSTDQKFVHLKEIRVELHSRRSLGNPFGGGRELVLQAMKAK
jgi:type II secretory pathway pseudopilin PulG